MGFAAATAPNRRLATVGPRARADDGKAFVVVYRNSRSVVVELDPTFTPWALFVVSSRDPETDAAAIRRAAGL